MVILVEVDTVTGRRIATTTTLTPPGMGEPTEGMENPKTRASAVMELVLKGRVFFDKIFSILTYFKNQEWISRSYT